MTEKKKKAKNLAPKGQSMSYEFDNKHPKNGEGSFPKRKFGNENKGQGKKK